MADTKSIRVTNQIAQGEQVEFSQVSSGIFTVKYNDGAAGAGVVFVGGTSNGTGNYQFTVPLGTSANDIMLCQAGTGGYYEYMGNVQMNVSVSGTVATVACYAFWLRAGTGSSHGIRWTVLKGASIVSCITQEQFAVQQASGTNYTVRKQGKCVYVNINVPAGTVTNTVLFTLPVEYRPNEDAVGLSVATWTNPLRAVYIVINSTGVCTYFDTAPSGSTDSARRMNISFIQA
jgi:hypothetical protein